MQEPVQPAGWAGVGDGGSAAEAAAELERLHAEIRACTLCSLHRSRTQGVPGTGPCPADVMLVGEAPGFNEDMQGKPFVGPAGKLLDTLLLGIGLSRGSVYITNVLKSRPPQNRDPLPSEVEACSPYLWRQLALVRPKLVLLLGRHAMERLVPGHGPISRVHGHVVTRGRIAYMPLYHPAAALHNPLLVNDLQADFDNVRRYLEATAAPAPDPEPVPATPPVETPGTNSEQSEQLSLL